MKLAFLALGPIAALLAQGAPQSQQPVTAQPQQPVTAQPQQAVAPEAAPEHVRITVRCISASNDPAAVAGLDPKLAPIATHLESFGEQFRFRSYRLLQIETVDLGWKAGAQIELPGSRSLQVTPRQLEPDGKIKVHLELLGEHPAHSRKLHTDYAIQRGGTILVGGLRVDPADEKSGKLLIAVTQEMEK